MLLYILNKSIELENEHNILHVLLSLNKSSLKLLKLFHKQYFHILLLHIWDSPTGQLFSISNVLPVRQRFTQLGSRYLSKAIYCRNQFIHVVLSDYISSFSTITARKKLATPLCLFLTTIALAQRFLVFIAMNILGFRSYIFNLLYNEKIQYKFYF